MRPLHVFRIVLTTRNPRTQEPFFVNFECDAGSLEELTARLNTGELVSGHKLDTHKSSEPGVFTVVGRSPFALSYKGVAHCELPTGRFVEFEEVADAGA